MIRLVTQSGPSKGREYLCKDDEMIIIGRSRHNRVPIADVMASRQHARLFKQDDTWWVEDLNSKNGTYINSVKKNKMAVDVGDVIQIGHSKFLIEKSSQGQYVGQEIAGYQCLEKIGEGGMGEVYKAHQKSLDRIVALKILSKKLQQKKNVVDNFINEARRSGSLNHPNIIHVHDVGQTSEGIVYFSMEYINGLTLKEWFKDFRQQRAELPYALLCRIFSKTAQALHFAHLSKVVHRDVKPDNIMLSRDGDVKLADLGISQNVGEMSVEKKKPGKRQVIGTPHYIAPEQILNRPVDGRLDIYSLGATAYHIFTGHTLFKGKKAEDIIKAHLKIKPTPPGDLNETLPEYIEDIIMKMLQKKPSLRYQQASEVATAFDQAAKRCDHDFSRKSSFFSFFKK